MQKASGHPGVIVYSYINVVKVQATSLQLGFYCDLL